MPKTNYYKIFLFGICILAFLLRFYKLNDIPISFSSDEASLGYNAYSILKTGKDEYGINWPLTFKSFGEYKAPLYIYASIPAIYLFDLNIFSTRFISAMTGVLSVFFLFLLILELFRNKNLSLLCALILAVIPWHLQYTRIAYEGSISLFFVLLATFFFVKGIRLNNLLILGLSAVFFSLSLYGHLNVRVFVPLYVIFLLIFSFGYFWKRKLVFIFFTFSCLLTFLPLLPIVFSFSGFERASQVNLFTDSGFANSINEKRAEHLWLKTFNFPSNLLHNKINEYILRFLDNYFSHFDLSFLFIKGDPDPIFNLPDTGLILWSMLPFLIIGIYSLIRESNSSKYIIFGWLMLAPLASAMTRFSASSNRAFIMIIPISICIGFGLYKILFNRFRFKKIVILSFSLLLIFEYILYLDNYYLHKAIKISRDERQSRQDVIRITDELVSKYDTIWITNKTGGYIHYLFHLKYPPEKFQKRIEITEPNEFGFNTVTAFDKYIFKKSPKYFDLSKNILYVSEVNEMPKEIVPQIKTFYPDGQIAFVFYDTEDIKVGCLTCDIKNKPLTVDIWGEQVK